MMKNKICQFFRYRFAVICFAVLVMFVLAGCSAGSTVDTSLVLEQDLSGVRRMTIVIDDGVFNQYFNGTVEDINALMSVTCPPELTWSYSDASGNKQYVIELAFSSLEDYKDKLTSILGYEPEVIISTPDSVWESGISVNENFEDTELLQWMKDMLVDNGYVDSSNAGNIFSSGSMSISYKNTDYRNGYGHTFNISEIDYVTLDDIHILTDINGWNDYNRKVVFRIPARSMEQKGDAIREYMDGIVPSGASGEWSDDDGETVFTVTASNLTAERLEAFDLTVFDSEKSSVFREDVSEKYSAFSFAEHFDETLDLTNFASGNNWIRYTYQVKAADSYLAASTYDGWTVGNEGYDSTLFNGYKVLMEGNANFVTDEILFRVVSQRNYNVKELTVNTDQGFGSNWERTSSFVFETVPDENEINIIVNRMEARAGIGEDSDEEGSLDGEEVPAEDADSRENKETKAAEVEISHDIKDGVFTLTIVQKGSPEAIKINSRQLFGNEGELAYARDKEFWKVKRQEAFAEKIEFGNLLNNVSNDFKIIYSADMGMLSSMQYCSVDSAVMDGSKLQVTFNNTRVNITYVGTETNLLAILFWVLIVVGSVSLVVLILKVVIAGSKVKAAAKPAVPAAPVTQMPAEQTQNVVQQTEQPATSQAGKFCEKCGAPREQGAKFCEKCGEKFED